jgi:hypothetical protein
VRVKGKLAEPWRINVMRVGDGSLYRYLHGDVRKALHAIIGDRVRIEVRFDAEYQNGPLHPMPAWFKEALDKNPQAMKNSNALIASRRGKSPLLFVVEISRGARPQPRKGSACALRNHGRFTISFLFVAMNVQSRLRMDLSRDRTISYGSGPRSPAH